jgi:hypothetical protein
MTREQREQQPRPVPRLVKAAELAARKEPRPATEAAREPNVASIARSAAVRVRAPRDARDARKIFDSLFGKPAA